MYEDRFHGSYTIPVLYGFYEVLQKIYLGELHVYGEYGIKTVGSIEVAVDLSWIAL